MCESEASITNSASKTRMLQKTTLARAAAISDIRNLATFTAANHAMVPITNHNLIIFADANQCQTSHAKKS
jgi:hypothetical protein